MHTRTADSDTASRTCTEAPASSSEGLSYTVQALIATAVADAVATKSAELQRHFDQALTECHTRIAALESQLADAQATIGNHRGSIAAAVDSRVEALVAKAIAEHASEADRKLEVAVNAVEDLCHDKLAIQDHSREAAYQIVLNDLRATLSHTVQQLDDTQEELRTPKKGLSASLEDTAAGLTDDVKLLAYQVHYARDGLRWVMEGFPGVSPGLLHRITDVDNRLTALTALLASSEIPMTKVYSRDSLLGAFKQIEEDIITRPFDTDMLTVNLKTKVRGFIQCLEFARSLGCQDEEARRVANRRAREIREQRTEELPASPLLRTAVKKAREERCQKAAAEAASAAAS